MKEEVPSAGAIKGEAERLKTRPPTPSPTKTLEMDILLLGSHSSDGSGDSDFLFAKRIDSPRAQCSCTDG